jgi:hypothetical protein
MDELTYRVIWPDEPDKLGIRCMQLSGLQPIVPDDPSSALHVGDWFGEDVLHGVRGYHRGSALMPSQAGAVAHGFVEMLTQGTLRNAGDPVDIDLDLVAGDWTRPERLRISGWWKQEWVLQGEGLGTQAGDRNQSSALQHSN